MIGHIASSGFHHLASSPSTNIAPGPSLSSISGKEEAAQQNPSLNNDQKVKASVSGQETQAGKKNRADQESQTTAKKPATDTNSPVELNEEELKEVQKLKQRDIEVRAHEAAHLAAAGQHAQGGAKFTLKRGPDGRSYAIGGSVSIDTSPEADPEATVRKADQIKRAALAPAEPSGQDRSVAAQAAKMKLEAQSRIAEEQRAPEGQDKVQAGDNTETAVKPDEDPKPIVSADTGRTESESKPGELQSGVDAIKSAAQALCEICSGDHPTAPHLEANQSKANQYLAVSQA